MKKRIGCVFLIACMTVNLCACSFSETASKGSFNPSNSDYNAEYALSANEYTIYVNKEISVSSNQLIARVSCLRKVISGDMKAVDELTNLPISLQTIQTCKDEISSTRPAVGYEDTRTRLLEIYTEIETAYGDCEEALKAEDIVKLNELADKIETLGTSLSGLGNVNYR